MATNLIEIFNTTAKADFIQGASGQLGESAESTTNAVQDILPALMHVLSEKSQHGSGVNDIMALTREHQLTGRWVSQIPLLFDNPESFEYLKTKGADILRNLFGEAQTTHIDQLAAGHGLKTSSASTLFKMLATLLLDMLAKNVGEQSLDTQGIRSIISRQTTPDTTPSTYERETPAIAFTTTTTSDGGSIQLAANPTSASPRAHQGMLPWIVLLLLSLGLFFLAEKGCKPAEPSPAYREEVQ